MTEENTAMLSPDRLARDFNDLAADMSLTSLEVRGIAQTLRAFEEERGIGEAMRLLANTAEEAASRLAEVELWASAMTVEARKAEKGE